MSAALSPRPSGRYRAGMCAPLGGGRIRLWLPLIASGVLAACGHQPQSALSISGRTMEVFDPANGIAYRLPCASCPPASDEGVKVATAAVEPTTRPTQPRAYRPVQLAAMTVDSAATVAVVAIAAAASSRNSEVGRSADAAAAEPIEAPAAKTPTARTESRDSTVESTTSSAALPALQLKLDTELASAIRMVPFAFGKSSLGSRGERAVRELIPLAKQSERVYVRGRTDASGSYSANRYIADKRATIVRKAFVAGGVPAAKIQTTYCTDCFIASNDTEAGRRGNRRVDVELIMTRREIARLPKAVHALEYPGDPPLSLSLSER